MMLRDHLRLPHRVSEPQDGLTGFPKIILWAWERPEDFSFLRPHQAGVAFLARTLYLRGDELIVRPRLQPLRLPDRVSLIATVRIETDQAQPITWSPTQRSLTANTIAELSRLPGVKAIQIDFDARQSDRQLYRELLRDVRNALDLSVPLSITALASWCMYDDWLGDLRIDEAVPMLFRMGVDHRNVTTYLNTHKKFRSKACQRSVGVSVDEALTNLPTHQKIYVFNPKSWSEGAVERMSKEFVR